MRWHEAILYIEGMNAREHSRWEQTRHLEWTVACIMSEKGKAPKSPRALYLFPWEDEEETKEEVMTDEKRDDLVSLLRRMKAENEKARKHRVE